ncbi:MAG: hypothetical protein M1538_03710 [Candidatus Marsarchaeota archaeon]|jgi:hypothetical protein|nr:hypothetical protein [Candidatus Marsarchaeota archaeon]
MEIIEDDAKKIIMFLRNYIELNSVASNLNKEIFLNNKINKKVKMRLKVIYKPTNILIWEATTEGINLVDYEIMKVAESLVTNNNLKIIFTKQMLNDVGFELDIISKQEMLGRNFISKLKNIDLENDGLLIKYGVRNGLIIFDNETKKTTKTKLFEEICTKIGLPKYYWKQPNIKLYKVKVLKFIEVIPGTVIRK